MLVLCIDDMMVLTSWEALLKQNGHDPAETLNQVKIKASLPTSHSTKKEKFSQNGDGGHCQLAYNQDCKMKKGAHTDFYKFKKRSHARGHIFSYLNPASCVLHVAKFKFGQTWNRIFKGFSVCLFVTGRSCAAVRLRWRTLSRKRSQCSATWSLSR